MKEIIKDILSENYSRKEVILYGIVYPAALCVGLLLAAAIEG